METNKGFEVCQDVAERKPLSRINAVVDRLKEFCGYTTAHGVGRLIEAKCFFWRLFWVIACVSAMTFFVLQVNSLQNEYSRRPVKTRIDVQHEIVRYTQISVFFPNFKNVLNILCRSTLNLLFDCLNVTVYNISTLIMTKFLENSGATK